ncbi:MAG: WecB/TagA/CpsF family glycosyltransferase, partial [Pirellulaceae bacterium]|nr:WecB/TagA/CpsF family glycosyltransferase [Pirellulaceae bacterium]
MTTWPVKKSLLGVDISVANYDEVVASVAAAAENHTPAVASFFAVHLVVLASRDAELRRMVNSFELIGPDGQPVRWGLNLLHRAGLRHRVYGPQAMLRICREAERRGHDIYLYGGTETTLSKLCDRLTEKFPSLRIAGAEAP